MKVIIYLLPLINGFFTLPNTSICTNSKGALDSNFDFWRGSLCALPNWHPAHTIFEQKSSYGSPLRMPRLDISYNFVYLVCALRACHNLLVSSYVYCYLCVLKCAKSLISMFCLLCACTSGCTFINVASLIFKYLVKRTSMLTTHSTHFNECYFHETSQIEGFIEPKSFFSFSFFSCILIFSL